MAVRKASEAIKNLFIPNSQRSRGDIDPYYYGMNENEWLGYMDQYHDYVKRGGDSPQTKIENIEDDLKVTPAEAEDFYKYTFNPRNRDNVTRHVAMGVPQAHSSELLIKEALNASGKPAAFMNQGSHFATDLQVMLGKLNQQVDVQNRFRSKLFPEQMDGIAAYNNLRDYVGQNVYNDAAAKDTLETIFNRTAQVSGRGNLDKLLQSRGRVKPTEVKDALIGGIYNQDIIPKRHGMRQNQGYYDITRPEDLYETDLNKLREILLPMSKEEFKGIGGKVLNTPRFKGKLQLQIPSSVMREMATPDRPYIEDAIRQEIIQRRG